jgi:hypothetical protein
LEYCALSHWYRVKLELAPNKAFPKGSPGRAYLLRLPLKATGAVDQAMLALNPKSAMVRRFWPNEPDRSGIVRCNSSGLALIFSENAEHPEHLQEARVLAGGTLDVAASDGSKTMFRVVSIRPD